MQLNAMHNNEPRPFPLPLIVALVVPVVFLLFFYISYAERSWFFFDDFIFLSQYAHSLQLHQLVGFDNFGRFVSRNVYWYSAIKLFSYNAAYFYVCNFLLIVFNSCVIYAIFVNRYDIFSAIIAALFYFALPRDSRQLCMAVKFAAYIGAHICYIVRVSVFAVAPRQPLAR